MSKILFWNTAGAGAGLQGEELAPTLTSLSSGESAQAGLCRCM